MLPKSISLSLLILFIEACNYSFSQSNAQNQLYIRDKCPDISIRTIINYPVKTAKLSDFSGKVLLLDFWATWCSPCIASFKKLDSLQKKFGNKLQILPVSRQDKKTVLLLLNKMKANSSITFPSVINDTVLNSLFRHVYMPHYVWINQDGIISAITGPEEVKADNIQLLLDGKKLNLTVKSDFYNEKDRSPQPTTVDNSNDKNNFIYHSTLTGFSEGKNGSFSMNKNRIKCTNVSIQRLYQIALGSDTVSKFLSDNRVIKQVEDPTLIFFPVNGPNSDFLIWRTKNTYCYELVVPDTLSKNKYRIMLQDLNDRMFPELGLKGYIEKQKIKSLALVRTSVKDKIKTKGEAPLIEENIFFYKIINQPISVFLNKMKTYYMQLSALPLIDETGYNEKIDLEINAKLSDVRAVNKELEKYDLQFIEKEKEISMIVISDKKNNNTQIK